MNIDLFILSVAFTALALAIISMPRWCFMTINRSMIWRLLDRLDGQIMSENIPYDSPAVLNLKQRITATILACPTLSPVVIWKVARFHDRHDIEIETGNPEPEKLSEDQMEMLDEIRTSLYALQSRNLALNSWTGILLLFYGAAEVLFSRLVGKEKKTLDIALFRRLRIPVASTSLLYKQVRKVDDLIWIDLGQTDSDWINTKVANAA